MQNHGPQMNSLNLNDSVGSHNVGSYELNAPRASS